MQEEKTLNQELVNKVEASLDNIRPYLEADGGNVEVVEITSDLTLKVRLIGACETCPMNITTMKAGIEKQIKKDVPEITNVQSLA